MGDEFEKMTTAKMVPYAKRLVVERVSGKSGQDPVREAVERFGPRAVFIIAVVTVCTAFPTAMGAARVKLEFRTAPDFEQVDANDVDPIKRDAARFIAAMLAGDIDIAEDIFLARLGVELDDDAVNDGVEMFLTVIDECAVRIAATGVRLFGGLL